MGETSIPPTTWGVDVDAIGAFSPSAFPQREGNYRIVVRDTLVINVPAGSLVNQDEVRLLVIDGVGEESSLVGTPDCLGNLRFEWVAVSAGPCSFRFEYHPYAASSSVVPPTRKRTESDLVLRRQGSTVDNAGVRYGVVNKVIVAPRIIINGKMLPVDALSMQTVVSRCLGPLDTWTNRLQRTSADLHYNVIHFTPVQVTGESGSCYSLADQLEISPELLPAGSTSRGWELLKSVVEELETRYGLMSTSDIVLNHTANNTHWIPHHPECGYNERNSPHLKAAIELDDALQQFSFQVSEGRFRGSGLPERIEDESCLKVLRRLVRDRVLNPFRLNEWFEIDFEASLMAFRNSSCKHVDSGKSDNELIDLLYEECLKTVGVARHTGVCPNGDVTSRMCRSDTHLRSLLSQVQAGLNRRACEVQHTILNAIEGFVRWERVQCNKGPVGKTHWDGLVPRYFTPIVTKGGETLHLANNGWVMDWDAEKDFAAPGSLVYLSRSLVAWSDCIKLRYGDCPDDCPFLWDLMKNYCSNTAKIFKGIRLDNCHSTPLHVAKYCLAESRKVNPNLWVYAELFTGKRETDLVFERELGLNALIREAMQSYNGSNLAWHVKEFGGQCLGAFDPRPSISRLMDFPVPLLRTSSPSLFFDCTHDNETPQQKRTATDALPNAAAVAASVSAIGSCRGYDELVPLVLSVVTERRLYHSYQVDDASLPAGGDSVNFATQARLNTSLHPDASVVVVKGSWDDWTNEIPLVHRHGVWTGDLPSHYYPESVKGFVSYQYKFVANREDWFFDPALPHSRNQSNHVNNILSMGVNPVKQIHQAKLIEPRQWNSKSHGLPGIMEPRKVLNQLHHRLAIEGFSEVAVESARGDDILIITRHDPSTHRMCYFFIYTAFSPAVLANPQEGGAFEIKGSLDEIVLEAQLIVPQDAFFFDETHHINGLPSRCQLSAFSKDLNSKLNFFDSRFDECTDVTHINMNKGFCPGSVFVLMTKGYPKIHEATAQSIKEMGSILEATSVSTKISRPEELHAFSYLLYSCNNEERDRSKGKRGCYELETIGALPYAGIAGIVSILDALRCSDEYDHPLIKNIVGGDWYFDYAADRLDTDSDEAFSGGTVVVLLKVASWLREASADALRYLPRKILPGYLDWIFSSLYSWVTQRFISGMPEPLRSCNDLFMLRLSLATLQFYGYVPSSPLIHGTNHPSLCAGLPHFATEYMRNWGRDTFIALEGCLLSTGRYQEAREEILGFARVMRHGLIPNLLDGGNNPRFNARDATWFFLRAIQTYCNVAPEGTDFLLAPITLKYSETLGADTSVETVGGLVHFILSQHAKGIDFREWNAGHQIDACMKDEGFNIKIQLDETNGILFGGNRWNCGTWMDKMGSSYEASEPWRDYQLRPNFCVALSVSPELLSRTQGLAALETASNALLSARNAIAVEQALEGFRGHFDSNDASELLRLIPQQDQDEALLFTSQLGMKTLDPSDYNYRPDYNNDDRSLDASVAHGFNYHNGPEWVWPLGHFLNALFTYQNQSESEEDQPEDFRLQRARFHTMQYLLLHRRHIATDKWLSLPELTNHNARFCSHSCHAQAWSIGTILAFLSNVAAASSQLQNGAETLTRASESTPMIEIQTVPKKSKRSKNR
ncbi:glycogen debranching enzyme-like [Condylostylus longicornis]|uniref:glycogen debranching enzyme-like n=1 Tax=Condylostylus longicornis TaxID=2530218 RepID=UPI00244DE433|nr:glycogen debranching enzyme-like [Condylostylus longicornis]